MAATKEVIVAIRGPRPGDGARKTVKIVATRDGSYSIAVPYHSATTGRLARIHAMSPVASPHGHYAQPIEEYRVDVPVKLSLHASGFVQFSQAGPTKIRSGKTRFHVPKGLGIESHSILDPIDTGPTWGVSFMQLSECQLVDGTEKTPIMYFDHSDVRWRDDHDMEGRHVFHVDGWVFPAARRREAYLGAKGWTLTTQYGVHRPEWIVDFRVWDLLSPVAFLGIEVNVWHGSRDWSGYSISSPKDLATGDSIHGTYPERPDDKDVESLVYVPPAPGPAGS